MMYVSWQKTLLVFIGVVVFSIICYFGVSNKAVVASKGDILLDGDFGIRAFSEGHRLLVKSKEEKENYGVIDQVYSLVIRSEDHKTVGQAVITLRKVPTQDLFVFVHLDSKSDVQLILEQSFDALSFTKIVENPKTAEVYPNRKKYKDPTSNTFTYYAFEDAGSVFVGGQYAYRKLIHTYPHFGTSSVVYDLVDEYRDHKVIDRGGELYFSLTTKANNSRSDSWYLVSQDSLFQHEEEFTRAAQIGIDEYKWLTPTDVIAKGLATIYPPSKMSFVRSLVRQSAKQSVIAYEETGSRFFEDLNWNSFVQLEQIRESDGLWYSNYTSTWLEDQYNIPTHYVDTRHNDNLFRAQARRAKNLGIKEYEDNYKIYADFLIRKLEEGRTIQTQNGKFLIDYFSDYSNELTHVSLNHALSLMNYFYYSYLRSGERKYLAAGDTLLQALVDTGEDWISENGNLRYQLNPDGTYQGNDYKLVTYYDLLYSKALLLEIKKKEYQVIEKLIEVKEAYLDGLGIDYRVDMERIEDYVGVIE